MQVRLIPEFDSFFKIAGGVTVSVFSFLLSLSWFFPQINGPLTILLTGVVFLGIPHGALDIFLISKMTPNQKERNKLLAYYVLSLFPMAAAWIIAPEGAFLFFVLFSAVHFAQSDMTNSEKSHIEFWTRFFVIFSLPFTFHTDKFSEIALNVLDARIFDGLIPVFQAGTILAAVGTIFMILNYLYRVLQKDAEFTTHFLELPVIFILFYFFDPLYAFGIYFCFIHSVKHVFNVMSGGIEFNFSELLPYWLLPLGAVLALLIFSGGSQVDLEANSLQSLMMIISAIALPHTILIHFCKSKQLIK